METEDLRAQVLATYQQGPETVVALVTNLLRAVASQAETLSARVTTLEEANARLRARLDTNSGNSSKPPSSDGPGSKPHPQSQRIRGGRPSGGQPGHAGHSLALVAEPDEVQVHAPARCPGCGHSLAAVPALRWERRQVVDLPPIRARVIEHQVARVLPGLWDHDQRGVSVRRGRAGAVWPQGGRAGGLFDPGAVAPLARTSALLAEVFGCPLTEGTLERAIANCYEQLAATEAAIKQGVTAAAVTHFDETGVNLNGTTAWLHVASTPPLIFYAVHPQRGQAAMDAIGVLPQFRGRAMHDGLTSNRQYTQCGHALCNAHHLRELTYVAGQLGQDWAKDLSGVLGAIKQAVDTARGQGLAALPAVAQ